MSYTRKVAFNTAVQMIGKAAGIAVSLVTVAALFRYFGVEGIGRYTTVFAFVGFFAVFADFGLQWTLIRELTINRDKEKVFKNIFAFRLILALVVHALAFGLVWFFNYPLEVKLGVGVITLAWFFTTVNSTLVGVFLNNYRMDISVTGEFLGRVAILAAVLLLVRAQAPLYGVMGAYLVGNVANFAYNFYFLPRFVRFGLRFDFDYWRHAIAQAIPIGIVIIFGFIYYKIDSLMLSLMRSMTDVGIYGAAFKLLEVLQVVPVLFLGAAFPLVTKYATRGDKRLKIAFQKQFDFLALLAVPIVAGTFILAEPIISFIAGARGSEFISASTVSFWGQEITSVTCLKILIFSVGVNFFSALYGYMVISLGRQKAIAAPAVGFAALNVVLNLILIPRWSYLGAAAATIITEIVVVSVYCLIARRFVALPLRFGGFAKTLLAGSLMAAAVLLLRWAGVALFANIAFAMAVYIALVAALKIVTVEDVRQIMRK